MGTHAFVLGRGARQLATTTSFWLFFGVMSVAAQGDVNAIPNSIPHQMRLYALRLPRTIDTLNAPNFIRGLEAAESGHFGAVIIHLSRSTGGSLAMADRISKKILSMTIPVYAYVEEASFSVANLVVLSCNAVYMAPEARIGDAVVRTADGELAGFFYQKVLYEKLYDMCQIRGLPFALVSALMGQFDDYNGAFTLHEEGILSANEATKYQLCAAKSDNMASLLTEHFAGYHPHHRQPTVGDQMAYFLLPVASCCVLALIMMCVYHLLREPKFGYPLLLFSVLLAGWTLFYYAQGTLTLTELWVGGGLLVLVPLMELLFLPFFCFLGYTVISLLPVWHFFAASDNRLLNFDHAYHLPARAIFLYVCADLLFFVLFFVFFRENFLVERLLKQGFMWWEHGNQGGASDFSAKWRQQHVRSLVGVIGRAHTMLRPTGKILIGGKKYYAIAPRYVAKGAFVGVVAVRDSRYLLLEVIPLDPHTTTQ